MIPIVTSGVGARTPSPATSAALPPELADLVGDVAELALVDLDRLVARMDAAVIELVPAFGADAGSVASLSASNRANIARPLTVWARRETGPVPIEVPLEALDGARTVARRGIDFSAIFQGYRRGQNIALEHYLDCAIRVVPSGPLQQELLRALSRRTYEWVDHVVAQVLAVAQHEREAVLGSALARRAETIRLILDGSPIVADRASELLGYDLARRHTALVLWFPPTDEVHGALESAATVLARASGARPPLTLSAGPSVLWAWMGTDADPARDELRAVSDLIHPDIRVAVGPTRPGIAGFRSTHAAALAIQGLLSGRPGGAQPAFYDDLEVTALAAQDPERSAEFVRTTLGRLAADTPDAARLRETLRVFLDEAENAPRTAARLHTHRNTILKRVARATELLDRPPGARRLATELALELVHQIGPQLLTRT